jgi:NADH:ubiquinone oxidoreductase subunit 6 (subunit J)
MPQTLFLDVTLSARVRELWPLALPVIAGLVAVYLLLPRPRGYPVLLGTAVGLVALLLAGVLLIGRAGVAVEMVLFYVFSGIALVGGGLLITQREPGRAALSFALVVLSTCGLFLLQAAPFLMAATIIIYAGAILVIFLFVIMLAQQAGRSDADHRSREPLLATAAGFILLAALLFLLYRSYDTRQLDTLIARTHRAAEIARDNASGKGIDEIKNEIDATLGNDEKNPTRFFKNFAEAAERAPGSRQQANLKEQIQNCQEFWDEWWEEKELRNISEALDRLAETALRVRDAFGSLPLPDEPGQDSIARKQLPSDNVAGLGQELFSQQYLLAVELGGTLLLVATIGAIAIAGRGREGRR